MLTCETNSWASAMSRVAQARKIRGKMMGRTTGEEELLLLLLLLLLVLLFFFDVGAAGLCKSLSDRFWP